MGLSAGPDRRPDLALLDDVRMIRLRLADFVQRLSAPPLEGLVFTAEGEALTLASEIWIVNDPAAAFMLGGRDGFDDPHGRRFARYALATRDWRRVADYWREAGGVATAENIAAAAIHLERNGEPAQPGSDVFVEIHAELRARKRRSGKTMSRPSRTGSLL